jgi:hypothetical protein
MLQAEDLDAKRKNIIDRIMALTDEQFELLITLYSQQQQESSQACPVPRWTSA